GNTRLALYRRGAEIGPDILSRHSRIAADYSRISDLWVHPATRNVPEGGGQTEYMNNRSTEAYGQHGMTFVDRFGVLLSQRAIRRWLPPRNDLDVLELGCGYRATQLLALRDRLKHGTGVDFHLAPELCQAAGFSFHEGTIEEALPKLSGCIYDVVLLISVL